MPIIHNQMIQFSAASGTAVSTAAGPVMLDTHSHPFAVGFGVVKGGNGGCKFSVQHTFTEPTAGTTWFTHADVSLKTASIDGNYAYPVRAIRLSAVTVSSSANLTFQVIQAGP